MYRNIYIYIYYVYQISSNITNYNINEYLSNWVSISLWLHRTCLAWKSQTTVNGAINSKIICTWRFCRLISTNITNLMGYVVDINMYTSMVNNGLMKDMSNLLSYTIAITRFTMVDPTCGIIQSAMHCQQMVVYQLKVSGT